MAQRRLAVEALAPAPNRAMLQRRLRCMLRPVVQAVSQPSAVIWPETEVPRLPPARAAYARGRGNGTWRSQLVCVFGVVVVTCICVELVRAC